MFTKIINNKVVRLVSDYKDGLLPVVEIQTTLPYPKRFYAEGLPTFTIKSEEVIMEYNYTELPLSSIKTLVYNLQKEIRKKKQFSTLVSNGVDIKIKNKNDSLFILSLTEEPMDFKVGVGKWVSLSEIDVKQLKIDHKLHVKTAYSWEKLENEKVLAINTVEELSQYLLYNGWKL